MRAFTTNGFLAGLVAFTRLRYRVSPTGSILIGVVAGVLVYFGVELVSTGGSTIRSARSRYT
ncbi:MAG TPA: hypothetical protein VHC72_21115 [Bryobacteraceae bacterium]|nr:hypothetical protein [Bryobacteraceae bacterium]